MDVFRLLTLTYTKYNDTPSQDAVEEVGMALVRRDETRENKFGVTEQILGWLSNEVGQLVKRGTAKCVIVRSVLLISQLTSLEALTHPPISSFSCLGPVDSSPSARNIMPNSPLQTLSAS